MTPVEPSTPPPLRLPSSANNRVGASEDNKGIKNHWLITSIFLNFLALFGITSGTYKIRDEGGKVYRLNRGSLNNWLEKNRDPIRPGDDEDTKIRKVVEAIQFRENKMSNPIYVQKIILQVSRKIELTKKIIELASAYNSPTKYTKEYNNYIQKLYSINQISNPIPYLQALYDELKANEAELKDSREAYEARVMEGRIPKKYKYRHKE